MWAVQLHADCICGLGTTDNPGRYVANQIVPHWTTETIEYWPELTIQVDILLQLAGSTKIDYIHRYKGKEIKLAQFI